MPMSLYLLTSWRYVQVRKDMGIYYESVRLEIKFYGMTLDYFRVRCPDNKVVEIKYYTHLSMT